MENPGGSSLPAFLELQRTRVLCKADAPTHTEGFQYSGAFAAMGVDTSVSVEKFCSNFKIEINRLTEEDMEFDMIGVDASIANAFRRILISEVPTMAIEKVFMVDNTSVIADEVLSHRLGLIPLDADPRLFEYISDDVPNERNTIVYKLHVSCEKGSQRLTVKSGQLEWLPEGSQLTMASPAQSGDNQRTYTSFGQSQQNTSERPLGVKYKDITIARLGPGQAIELEAHAVKGVGKVHAKWSPVATAWYRMLPEVVLLKEIKDGDAEELVKKCPVNVFDIEDLGNGKKRAVVAKPRACTLCTHTQSRLKPAARSRNRSLPPPPPRLASPGPEGFAGRRPRRRRRGIPSARMSGGGAGGGGGGGKGAGPVPQASKKLVQSLKEIVNRPEAEIYAALRECAMDPDEAVSRLLSQDTFQEVKSKRDKKKEVKETPEPRSRAANNATSRGVRGGPDRGGRNNSAYNSSIDNMTSRSSVSGSGMPSTNSTQKQTVPSSSVNKNLVADAPSVPPQTSSGFQHGWSGTPGQLSMADIVKMGGRPQAQGKPSTKPVVTADKGYAGQYPSLPTTVNQITKQSVSTVAPTELDQGLPSAQDSVLVKDHSHTAADNKQKYDNDWAPQDDPPVGNQSSLPETSGDPSLYDAPLHPSSLVADAVYLHENSYLDDNISAAMRSGNASERHLDHYGGSSEYSDGLLQNSSTYLAQTHPHIEDQAEESNADVSAAANFQGLSLHDEELAATKFAEDNPAVIIPDHLQVANTGCAGLSFGSFGSGAFSGLLPPPKSTENNVELPIVEESEPIDHTDTRDQDFYEIPANSPPNENLEEIMGANTENLDVPSVQQPDVLRQEILDDPSGVQYNLPSVSSHTYANPAQPNAMDAMQGSNQAHTLSHLSSLLQSNTLQQHNLLGSNMAPLRDLDFGLSPLLAAQAQSMGARYNSAAPTTTGMQEPMKPGVFSNTQSTQNLPSTSIHMAPSLPQQLVHPYSQPTLPIAPFANMIGANMIGYNPYLAQNYPAYLPSTAFQQAYSSNGQFHQSAAAVPGAGMKYSMPQYKNNMSAANLQQQQQPSSVISGYAGFGSSSNLPGNFALNQNAAPASANLGFDEALSAQYKEANQYMALQQQGDNSAMWLHGAGSRTASALPPTQFYGYQGQSQQQGAFRQAQQPQQPSQYGGHGYPAFYHNQGGLAQEHHPQNPADGTLNGYQAAAQQQQQQQPSHQSWQQHTSY